jgi:probable HAF family extracellular repeat protein
MFRHTSETNLVEVTDMQDVFWSAATGIVELGHLGGGARRATDINEAGTVVGGSPVIAGDTHSEHAFMWTLAGGMRDLGTLGGELSSAHAINARDEVAGMSWAAPGYKPTKWVGGVPQQLDTLDGFAYDINNSGHVVGSRVVDGRYQATLWQDGVAIDLGAGPGSEALRINDLDVIVGTTPTGVFVWSNPAEGAVMLPSLGGENRVACYSHECMPGNFIAGWSHSAEEGAPPRAVRWEVQVTPLSDDGTIVDLQDSVDALEESGGINSGEASSLDAKLDGALAQCERGNETAARNQIEAFINHTRALIRSGRVSAADGEALITEAQALLASLDCTP